MHIAVLQHVPFEGPALIEHWAKDRGHVLALYPLYKTGAAQPVLRKFDMLVIMGGPMSVHDNAAYDWLPKEKRLIQDAISGRKIVVGICLGAQLIAQALGASVYPNHVKEIGWFPVVAGDAAVGHPVLSGINSALTVFHWHGETFDLPAGAQHLFSSKVCRNQAFLFGNHVLGLQFHLEMDEGAISKLVKHCGEEIVPAETVQQGDSMLEAARRHIPPCKTSLYRLLDNLVSLSAVK